MASPVKGEIAYVDGKRGALLNLGERISKTSNPSEIRYYITSWNAYVKKGGIVSEELQESLDNVIEMTEGRKIARIKIRNETEWLLRSWEDIEVVKEYVKKWIPPIVNGTELTPKQPHVWSGTILEWLKNRGKLKVDGTLGNGKFKLRNELSFFEIDVNFDNGSIKRIYIPNKRNSTFNKNSPFIPADFGSDRTRGKIIEDIFDRHGWKSFSESEKIKIKQKLEKYLPLIEPTNQHHYLQNIYTLKKGINIDVFDEILETEFYNHFLRLHPSEYEKTGLVVRSVLKNISCPKIRNTTRMSFTEAHKRHFKVAFIDRNLALDKFVEGLKSSTGFNTLTEENIETFKKAVRYLGSKKAANLYEEARKIVSRYFEHITKNYCFSVEDALEDGFNISEDLDILWNEDRLASFTSIAAAIMQSESFRDQVISKLRKVVKDVQVTITGKSGGVSDALAPDLTVTSGGKIVEEVEVKLLKNFKQLNPEHYFLDFFKTLDSPDSLIKKISLHFIKADDAIELGWDFAHSGLGGIVIEFGDQTGSPRRLNEIVSAMSRERWPKDHGINAIAKIRTGDLTRGVVKRLDISGKRLDAFEEVVANDVKNIIEAFNDSIRVGVGRSQGYLDILIEYLIQIGKLVKKDLK